ncbi:MAG: DUF2442 domain-containing protein [Acidimicrobiales bacterium]
MVELVRVSQVEVIAERTLRVVFTDGLVRELDFAGVLTGVLAELDDAAAFGSVAVDPVAGTVCWPGGIDLDPDVLHGDARPVTAPAPRLIRQYRAAQAG